MSDKLKLYKVVVLGDGGVGKTALTIQLCLNHFVETYDPTIEDSYRKQIQIDDQPCVMEILDTAGQEEYHALVDQWLIGMDGFLVVYSITNRASFAKVNQYIQQIYRADERPSPLDPRSGGPNDANEDDKPPIPIILVGNKADRADRTVSVQEGNALAKQLYSRCKLPEYKDGKDSRLIEASAKHGLLVETAFTNVVREIRKRERILHGSSPTSAKFSMASMSSANDGNLKKMRESRKKLWGKSCVIL